MIKSYFMDILFRLKYVPVPGETPPDSVPQSYQIFEKITRKFWGLSLFILAGSGFRGGHREP
jgi:hypothetical protein